MAKIANRSGDTFISWLALILSIIAIILAWSAYRSANENGSRLQAVDDQINEQRVAQFAESAREEVGQLGQNIDESVEFNPEAISTRVAELRSNLQARFEDQDEGTQDQLQELDIDLSQLQEQLADGTISTIEALQNALERIQQGIGN